ncbi:MAG TPA: hypothetical protein VIL30_14455 [Ramlibacter sp.]|jgi:hypothetical protein
MPDTALRGNSRNRHPVDQLADVRQQIKDLQAQESDLKALISMEMGSSDSLGGDEFICRQKIQERKGGLDEAKLKAAGIKVDLYRKPPSVAHVLLVERRAAEAA